MMNTGAPGPTSRPPMLTATVKLVVAAEDGLHRRTDQQPAHAALEGLGDDRQRAPRRLEGALELLRPMREARRDVRDEDALVDHLLHEQRPQLRGRRAVPIEDRERGTARLAVEPHVVGDAAVIGDRTEPVEQGSARAGQRGRDVTLLELRKRRERGGDRVGLATMRRREEEHALLRVPEAAELHDVAAADERGDREPVSETLAERRQIGRDAEALLRAAQAEPEAADHLVEDEDGALAGADLPQALEESVGRTLERDRLEDDRGDPPRVRGE